MPSLKPPTIKGKYEKSLNRASNKSISYISWAFFGQRFEVICDCSFCWVLWNCWSSLFKLSFCNYQSLQTMVRFRRSVNVSRTWEHSMVLIYNIYMLITYIYGGLYLEIETARRLYCELAQYSSYRRYAIARTTTQNNMLIQVIEGNDLSSIIFLYKRQRNQKR